MWLKTCIENNIIIYQYDRTIPRSLNFKLKCLLGIHIALTQRHMQPGVIDQLITDVKEIAEHLCSKPPSQPSGAAAMYGMAAQIPDRLVTLKPILLYYSLLRSLDLHAVMNMRL